MPAKRGSPIEAEVTDVCGPKGRMYAVTRPSEGNRKIGPEDTITFSLEMWLGTGFPKAGQIVHLFGVEKFRKGWRAQRAEPVQL